MLEQLRFKAFAMKLKDYKTKMTELINKTKILVTLSKY